MNADRSLRPNSWPNFALYHRWLRLLWSEWFAHSHLILFTLSGWLAVVWAVPFFAHPLWVLTPSLLISVIAGPSFGGADVIHGVEEFAFSFPITRSERFLSRSLLGAFLTLFISAAGVFLLEDSLHLAHQLLARHRVDDRLGFGGGFFFVAPLPALIIRNSTSKLRSSKSSASQE